jgi:tetratricopeptide (TPR) repeat protein
MGEVVMQVTPVILSCALLLSLTLNEWGAGSHAVVLAQADDEAPAAVNDPGTASAEPKDKGTSGDQPQSEWEKAANPGGTNAPAPQGDSVRSEDKTVKTEVIEPPEVKPASEKAALIKATKAALDSAALAKAPLGKAESKAAENSRKLGDQLFKKNQVEKAIAAYKQCIEIAGDDTAYGKIIKILADYNLAKKKYAEAAKYYSMVKGALREQPAFKISYSRCLQAIGKNAEAIELVEPLAAERTLRLESRKELWKILGDAYCKSDMNEKATEWYGKYVKAGGTKNADIVYLLTLAMEKIAPLKAKAAYTINIKSYPTDYRNFLRLAIIMSKSKPATKLTTQRTTTYLKKASDLAGKNSMAWLEIGKTYGTLGKTDEEMAAYQTALRYDKGNLQAKNRVGAIYLSKGMTSDAIGLLEDAHKMAPDSIGPLVSLATAYIKTNKTDDAIDLLLKAKAAKPKDPAIHKLLYEAYKASGKDQQAIEEIKAAIDLKRDNESLLAYGKILLKTGKLDEAASVMEDIRSTAPDNIDALMTLALVFRAQKKFDQAIDIYKEVTSIDAKQASAMFERAETYLAQSKMKWAEQFYQRALETDPKMAAAEVGLARVALAYGNKQAYQSHLDKASSMDPNNPIVKKEIENSRNSESVGK